MAFVVVVRRAFAKRWKNQRLKIQHRRWNNSTTIFAKHHSRKILFSFKYWAHIANRKEGIIGTFNA